MPLVNSPAAINIGLVFDGYGTYRERMLALHVRSSLFDAPSQTLVNTVNTEGVMGKGVAKEFKRLYPDMFQAYKRLCDRSELGIGKLHLWRSAERWVLNFPTKTTWRQPSRLGCASKVAFRHSNDTTCRWEFHPSRFSASGMRQRQPGLGRCQTADGTLSQQCGCSCVYTRPTRTFRFCARALGGGSSQFPGIRG